MFPAASAYPPLPYPTSAVPVDLSRGEREVERALIRRVTEYKGPGRIIATQFASNIHRLGSLKKAADMAGRKMCFLGMSLTTYLEAAKTDGRAPFDPKELISQNDLDQYAPNGKARCPPCLLLLAGALVGMIDLRPVACLIPPTPSFPRRAELLIVTTGSQAEPRSQLNMASKEASALLKLSPEDLILYSAKVIPGNETRVMRMMNRISQLGPEIAMGRNENLHTSGHAYRGEQEELLRLVKPQNFLPVHGEYAFLCAHAQLGRDCGVQNTHVIRNGQMLGVYERRNARVVSQGSMQLVGEASLLAFYNDGGKGTGTAAEMAMEDRVTIANEGVVVCAIDLIRAHTKEDLQQAALVKDLYDPAYRRLSGAIKVTSRAMWTNKGHLLAELHKSAERTLSQLPYDTDISRVEREVAETIRKVAK